MEQYIVSNCHRNCNLHGMLPNCQLVFGRSYALIQAELNMRPRSATARDPTNRCVPTCESLRRHTSTTNTMMLPSVPTTKTIHSTTTLTYVNQLTFEIDAEVNELAVVPVEFQTLVSSELFSFANGTGLVTFISACTESYLVRVSKRTLCSLTRPLNMHCREFALLSPIGRIVLSARRVGCRTVDQ